MKIKFENQKWFEFLRDKFPKNVRCYPYTLNDLGNSSRSEFVVASSVEDLRKFIANSLPKELKQSEYDWIVFEYNADGFKKEIRFCQSSDFETYDGYGLLYKPGRFLKDFTLDTDPPTDFKEEKEETKMASSSNNNHNNTSLNLWGMTKEDFKDGLWRNGANEMVEVVKFGILKACKVQKMNKLMYETVRKTLDYKVVTGGIHAALGYALTYIPMLSSHPQAARMAKELRVEGFKFVQSEVIDAIKDLVPDLLKILSSVSPEEEKEQRIHVEEKNATQRISAPELVEHQASIEAIAEKETVQAKRTATVTN